MTARRRSPGEGTIYKRPNGTWCAQLRIGGGRRLTHYAKTQNECRRWLHEVTGQLDTGLVVESNRVRLEEYLTKWLEIAQPSLRASTWQQYRHIVETHIVPIIGSVRLKSLRPDHLQALYTHQLTSGVGVRTVQLVHAVLHRSLSQAVTWGLLVRNPAAVVRKPARQRREMQTLTAEQCRQLLEAAAGSRYLTLYHLAITTGLRQGELLGLRWTDLTPETASLRIQRQLCYVRGAGIQFIEPKTDRSRRAIIISAADLEMLQRHRVAQIKQRLFTGARWQEHDLIFPSTIGTPTSPRNLVRDFKDRLVMAGLPHHLIRFHDLRHTAATLMLQSGVHPKVVQERLGHADVTITLQTYSHVLPSLQVDAAEKISRLLMP